MVDTAQATAVTFVTMLDFVGGGFGVKVSNSPWGFYFSSDWTTVDGVAWPGSRGLLRRGFQTPSLGASVSAQPAPSHRSVSACSSLPVRLQGSWGVAVGRGRGRGRGRDRGVCLALPARWLAATGFLLCPADRGLNPPRPRARQTSPPLGCGSRPGPPGGGCLTRRPFGPGTREGGT